MRTGAWHTIRKTYFYYKQLTSDEKKLYVSILNAVREGKTSAQLENTVLEKENISRAVYAFEMDYPELFYVLLTGRDECVWYNNKTKKTTRINFCYSCDEEERKKKIQERENFIRYIISNVPDSVRPSDYLTALWLHDLLAKNIVYDEEAPDLGIKKKPQAYSIEGAMNKTAVCAGIADLYMMLCERMDVWCTCVSGDTHKFETPDIKSGRHRWNLLRLNGEYCYADVTWDLKDEDRDFIDHEYFGMSTVQCRRRRIPDEKGYLEKANIVYPECRDPNPGNYFVREHCLLSGNKDLENFIDGVMRKKKDFFSIQLQPLGHDHKELTDNVIGYINKRLNQLRGIRYTYYYRYETLVITYVIKY